MCVKLCHTRRPACQDAVRELGAGMVIGFPCLACPLMPHAQCRGVMMAIPCLARLLPYLHI